VFTCVWLEGELIGFGRAISDGVFRAMIDDVIVDENHRGLGIGAMIMSDLLQQLADVDQVFLNTRIELHGFYRSKGFEKFEGHTMRMRKILSESV
jgi:GNAT superfamily N-acetyltransferase